MKKISLLLAMTCFGWMAQAADLVFEKGAVDAHVQWIQGPQETDESIFQLTWLNPKTGQAVAAPAAFSVTIEMPSMPMNNPPTTVTPVHDQNGQPVLGEYQVSGLYFTMGGDWDVLVHLTSPGGSTIETESFSVKVDGSGM